MPDLPPGPHLPAAWPAPVRRRPAGFFSQSALFAHEPAPVADKCSPRRQIRALLAGEPALFCRIRAPLAHGPAPLGRKRAPLDDRPAPFCQIRAIIADRPALLGQRPAPVRRLFQAKWMNLRRCCHKLGRNLTKLDTTTMNGGAADWSAAPATTDVGEFGATPTLAHMAAMTLGGNLTLGGLQMDGTTLGPLTVASGNTLTLGTSGINMSAANNNMTFNCALTLGGAQTWNVASGRTLTIGGSSISAGANLLTIAGAGSTSIGATAIISSTGGITKVGGSTFTLNGNTTQHNLGSSTLAVNGGILNLVIPSTGIANIIASTASLSLGGGGFNYSYAVGNSQSFATLDTQPGRVGDICQPQRFIQCQCDHRWNSHTKHRRNTQHEAS